MNTMSLSKAVERLRWTGTLLPWLALLSGAVANAAQEGESVSPAPAESTTAVWKVRELSFMYRSNHVLRSCHDLQHRVAVLLRAIGARDDMQVQVRNCHHYVMPTRTNRAFDSPADRFRGQSEEQEQIADFWIRVMLPVEVTPQVLEEIERDKSRRELVSRVTGNAAAMLNDPVPFPAARQPITLSSQTIGLEPEDCELLDQMRSVFREVGVRIVSRSLNCGRYHVSRIPPKMEVEALVGVPIGATALPTLPTGQSGGGSNTAPEAAGEVPTP